MAVILLETIPGIRDMVLPSNYVLVQDVSDQIILGLCIMMRKYYNGVPNEFWAEHSNMGPWPITLVVFGFYFGMKRLGPWAVL